MQASWAAAMPTRTVFLISKRPVCMRVQGQLPRPTDIMSLRIDNGERATLELADIALSPTRYIASWLRQRGWRLPEYRCLLPLPGLLACPMDCLHAAAYQARPLFPWRSHIVAVTQVHHIQLSLKRCALVAVRPPKRLSQPLPVTRAVRKPPSLLHPGTGILMSCQCRTGGLVWSACQYAGARSVRGGLGST